MQRLPASGSNGTGGSDGDTTSQDSRSSRCSAISGPIPTNEPHDTEMAVVAAPPAPPPCDGCSVLVIASRDIGDDELHTPFSAQPSPRSGGASPTGRATRHGSYAGSPHGGQNVRSLPQPQPLMSALLPPVARPPTQPKGQVEIRGSQQQQQQPKTCSAASLRAPLANRRTESSGSAAETLVSAVASAPSATGACDELGGPVMVSSGASPATGRGDDPFGADWGETEAGTDLRIQEIVWELATEGGSGGCDGTGVSEADILLAVEDHIDRVLRRLDDGAAGARRPPPPATPGKPAGCTRKGGAPENTDGSGGAEGFEGRRVALEAELEALLLRRFRPKQLSRETEFPVTGTAPRARPRVEQGCHDDDDDDASSLGPSPSVRADWRRPPLPPPRGAPLAGGGDTSSGPRFSPCAPRPGALTPPRALAGLPGLRRGDGDDPQASGGYPTAMQRLSAEAAAWRNDQRRRLMKRVVWIYFRRILLAYLVPAVALVAAILVAFRYAPLQLCGFQCVCSIRAAVSFGATYGLAMNLPRCLLFSCLTELLVHGAGGRRVAAAAAAAAVADTAAAAAAAADARTAGGAGDGPVCPLTTTFAWNVPTASIVARRPAVIALTGGSLALALSLEAGAGVFGLPVAAYEALRIFGVITPFFFYALFRGRADVGVLTAVLQLIPSAFALLPGELMQSSSMSQPVGARTALPLIVFVIERAFFYVLYAAHSADKVPLAAKVMLSHLALFFPQAVVVASALSLHIDGQGATVAAFGVQVVLLECLCGTLLVERLFYSVTGAVVKHVLGRKPDEVVMLPTDLRSVATQTRVLTAVLALLVAVPSAVVQRWPRQILDTPCSGEGSVRALWGAPYLVMWAAIFLSHGLTSLARKYNACLRPPLAVDAVSWSILCSSYLGTQWLLASNYLS